VRKRVGVTGRASSLLVDDARIEGTLIPPAPAGSTVTVMATIER
jgi:cellobiose phosphorylase